MTKKIFLSNNIRSIRAQTKHLPLNELESVLDKLKQVVAERQIEDKHAKANLAKHNQKVEQYLAQIKQDGINITELLKKADFPTFKKLRKNRPTRPPKYKYFDQQGNLRTWTGQGRMPKPIQLALHNTKKSLKDFLI
ncbi:DNA-binding transcriptional regulator H-NS [Orbus sasakiae]|uniref:DNA-binding protein n=1 Tax=Orbus sasakiae TaxID=1078475 RepID=A0ABP9N2N6_9GAMM